MRASAATAAFVTCICLFGCGGTAQTISQAQVSSTTPAAKSSTTRDQHSTPRPAAPDPGRLPQTHELPSAATPAFHAEMTALWSGISFGSLAPALPAFFPKGAYVQLKTIYDASGDYTGRLVGDYQLDIEAAHQLLGAHASAARLVEVQVPGSYVHWVDPGVCDNQVGYWEVPNARVVYMEDGQVRSFGIASMISWRGMWYVVHLGAVVRDGNVGLVDDPSSGPGVSVASSTC